MERSFSRSLESMGDLVGFVESFATNRLSVDEVPTIQLVVEEIFTNMVQHNASGADNITVGLDRNGHTLTITITDLDSDRFDPRELEPVDVSAPLKERSVGGLGIHLVRHMVDEIHYRYKDRESKVTLIKKLKS